jgi:cyclophilin family peptidyl-prolyl cis-trans isomerase
MPKSRDRHLAKNAERRRLERTRAKRSKQAALGVGGVIAAVLLVLLGIGILSRDSDQQATDTPKPTPTPTVTVPGGSSPTKTGTVTAKGSPAAKVACGGDVPASASRPKPQFDRAPAPDEVLKKNTTYTATIETSCGAITVRLDEQTAPQTVANFVFLAEQGYFDGQFVTRVVDSIDAVQTGDPTGTGGGGPGYAIPDELGGKIHYAPGTIAMANRGPNTGGSQFFLITGPEGANLDGNPSYPIFGQVTAGLDVAKQINGFMETHDGTYDGPPTEAVYIEKVTIEQAKTPPPASPSPSG